MFNDFFIKRRFFGYFNEINKRLEMSLKSPLLIQRNTPYEIYKDRVTEAAAYDVLRLILTDEDVPDGREESWLVFLSNYYSKFHNRKIVDAYQKWHKRL